MAEEQIPIQPVENPILCSPYKEPDPLALRHPDRHPAARRRDDGRRAIGSRPSARAARRLGLSRGGRARRPAAGERAARRRAAMAGSGWENASETTKKLLRHWWREDRGRRLFFCQVEAVETIIYLREILALGEEAAMDSEADAWTISTRCPREEPASQGMDGEGGATSETGGHPERGGT